MKKASLILLLAFACTLHAEALSVEHLRVQSLPNPQGVDDKSPLFSWQLCSDERGVEQAAYQLTVTSDAEGQSVVWESGQVASSASVGVTAQGLTLNPSTRYFWHVTVWDNKGNQATSSETAYFDTGLMSANRNPLSPAIWITAPDATQDGSSASESRYSIDFDMFLAKGRASVIFATTAPGDYLMWQINCQDYDQPEVRRHVYVNGSSTTTNTTVTQFAKSDILGHLRHYCIEVEGKTVRTLIDGKLVDTFISSSGNIPRGDIGMRIYGTAEEAYFDNIKVTSFDGTGNGTVTLEENFEKASSDYFIDAVIEEKAGSRMCHLASASGEKKVMQAQSSGTPMFRKAFTLSKPVREAKLYTSGLGIYDVFINGRRVGHLQPDGSTLYEELKPGWTDYRSRVFYSFHDVTTLLSEGANAIGAVVTSGWWAGNISGGVYGSSRLGFIAKLIVTYEDLSQETLVTDLTWTASKDGPLRSGDIYDGEVYDARLESEWTTAGFNDSKWSRVGENTDFKGQINAFTGGYVLQLADKVQSVREVKVYKGIKSTGTSYGAINIVATHSAAPFSLRKGEAAVIDFGQNLVGWVKFKVRGKSGNRLHLRFSEMLNDTGEKSRGNDGPGGTPYLTALRSAKAECYYTLAGRKDGEEYHPTSTFFGFRYCQILPAEDVEILAIEAQPISSSTEETGTLTTSDKRVNQLISNIQWGQRGNLLSVPTDCPQRNERLGWTGDTQIFCQTAMFNAETESFFRKWLQDMRDSQRSDGAYSTVAPFRNSRIGSGAWADAGIIVPWKAYLMYGDKAILRENFASMEKYMNWLATQTEDGYKYVGGATNYGDWVSYVPTDKRYVSVAYYAYDALLMAKICRTLSPSPNIGTYARKAAAYETLFKNICDEFRSRYLTPTVKETSQTALLLALQFDLLNGETEVNDFKTRLSQAIRDNGYKLNTGFVGTGILNTTLSRFGLTDYAYDLLLQRDNPSWLYSVDQGATTIWERWNSYTLESGFGEASMNSFNHYAYGAVAEWMYRYMVGLEPDESAAGFKHILLCPQPDYRSTRPQGQPPITHAAATFRSRYGLISAAWSRPDEKTFTYDCTVPPNTTATLRLPAQNEYQTMLESGIPAKQAQGVKYVGFQNGHQVYELGSGTYHFFTDGTVGVGCLDETEAPSPVYDLFGRMRQSSTESLSLLPKGIYIMTGKKVLRF